jgi:hypothetical protein
MARYSAFLGRFVDVQYRAGDICLPASGTFVADSGRSIFLEQHYEQHGQSKNFRWEIPYPCIVRLEPSETFRSPASRSVAQSPECMDSPERVLRATAAHANAGASALSGSHNSKPV